ncbi:MAG: O-antigen ligase family protein [Patescibacteria group bacterium]
MNFSWQKIIFFILFFVALLTSFLFAETIYSYLVVFLFCLVFFVGQKVFPFKKNLNTHLLLAIFGFLLFVFLALLFSSSWAISLHTFIRYVSLFLIFIFFSSLDFSAKEREFILDIFFFLGFSLSFVALGLMFLPNLAEKIPPINLIYSSYGHNHLGTFLLLLAPLSIRSFIKQNKKIYFFITIFFYLVLMISFGRVLLFLSILQLFVLINLKFNSFKEERFIDKNLKVIFYLSILLLASQLVFSGLNNCQYFADFQYKDQLCKEDFSFNVRHFYWSQAIISFFRNPWLGNGPGTFEVVSYQYRQIPELWTKFVHNDFLQIFTESGVFAGLFFILIVLLVFMNIKTQGQDKNDFSFKLVFLALGSFIFDIFFDYNFHLFGLAVTFLLLSSLFIGGNNKVSVSIRKIKPFLNLSFALLLLFSIFNFFVSGLIFIEKEKTAFRIFPYFYHHAKVFIEHNDFSIQDKKLLADNYFPLFSDYLLTKLPADEKEVYEYQLWSANPWLVIESDLPAYHYNHQDVEKLRKTMTFIDDFFVSRQTNINFQKESLDHKTKSDWSRFFIYLAENDFKNKNLASATANLLNAYKFDEWSLAKKLPFLEDLLITRYSFSEKVDFLTSLEKIPAEQWGDNRETLAKVYYALLVNNLDLDKNLQKRSDFVRRMLDLAEWSVAWFKDDFNRDNLNLIFTADQEQWGWHYISLLQLISQITQSEYSTNQYLDLVFFQEKTVNLEKVFQSYYDFLLENSNENKVLVFDEFLKANSYGLYWIPAQRGYVLARLFSMEKAEHAFQTCFELNQNNHECKTALESIREKSFDQARYEEIRQLIFGF